MFNVSLFYLILKNLIIRIGKDGDYIHIVRQAKSNVCQSLIWLVYLGMIYPKCYLQPIVKTHYLFL